LQILKRSAASADVKHWVIGLKIDSVQVFKWGENPKIPSPEFSSGCSPERC
jgi:hypothetical protein